MKKIVSVLCVLILSLSLLGCGANGTEQAQAEETSLADQQLVTNAYIFTLPLMLMDATATVSTNTEQVTDSRAPINQLHHATHLVDASFTDVVTPNVDTIYSQAHLDLSDDALVFYRPGSSRFLSVEVMDYYTNSVAILGTGGDTQEACTYLITGPDWQGEAPGDLVHVAVPTNNASMIIRTLIYDEADMVNVASLQEKMQMVPYKEYQKTGFDYTAPHGEYDESNDFVPVEQVLSLSAEEYFERANELMIKNPPLTSDAAIADNMATIGVGPGLIFDSTIFGADFESFWRSMTSSLHSELFANSIRFVKTQGAWQFYGEPIAQFGTEYAFRALVALDGLGANPVSVAVYPKAETDDLGNTLSGAQSYTIHFEPGQLPPVESYGFWSITAYGQDNFLIANEFNRYSINDRSWLTYNEDGSVDILVQATPPQDESMLGNWLPVGQEQFHLYMRIYLPSASVFDGSWVAPRITLQQG